MIFRLLAVLFQEVAEASSRHAGAGVEPSIEAQQPALFEGGGLGVLIGIVLGGILGAAAGAVGGIAGIAVLAPATAGAWRGTVFMVLLGLVVWPLLLSLRRAFDAFPPSAPVTVSMVAGILAGVLLLLFRPEDWLALVLLGLAGGFGHGVLFRLLAGRT